jgi:ABC-2 type transport system ATP-binding protein
VTWAIEAHALVRDFGKVKAVDGVDFHVEPGEVFALLGPNGAGKTTMVRMLAGVLSPTSGEARVLGHDPAREGDLVRRQLGVLTESASLYERLTARDNLLFFGRLYGMEEHHLKERVDELLETFGLAERAGARTGAFSKGMKQRLSLARVLLHEPPVLFLDEPTAGLDPEVARQVTNSLAKLSRGSGRTVLLCTHNLAEAQRLCDRVAVMNRGRLLAVGSVQELENGLWGGRWVDIDLQSDGAGPVGEAIRRMEGVIELRQEGCRISVQLNTLDSTPRVVEAVVRAGGHIARVNPREHSLEDIYFRLQSGEKGAAK